MSSFPRPELFNLFKGLIPSAAFVALGSCTSLKKEGTPSPILTQTPTHHTPAKTLTLPLGGPSREGSFSDDGRRILFVGLKREKHRNPQVYEFDLVSRRVRRLTYDDGINSQPKYISGPPGFIFLSTSDESKEAPNVQQLLVPNRERANLAVDIENPYTSPSFEVYRYQFQTKRISRLTRRIGYDGELSSVPKNKKSFLFVSYLDSGPELMTASNPKEQNRIWKPTQKFFLKPQISPRREVNSKADQSSKSIRPRWAWLSGETKSKLNLFVDSWPPETDSNPQPFDLKNLQIHSFNWHPFENSLVLSGRDGAEGFVSLFSLDLESRCLRRLQYDAFDSVDPTFSPDGKAILFTSLRSGTEQLHLMEYSSSRACDTSPSGPK